MTPGPSDQEEVLRAVAEGKLRVLARPAQRIDTHMSSVFLTEKEAIKIKLARRHPFADMRGLEVRRRLCERELELNRAMAKEIYLSVEAISREADGALAVGGRGIPVEWFVRMRRFRNEDLLSEVARSGGLNAAVARDCAFAVCRLHRSLAPLTGADEPARYLKIISGLRRTLRAAAAAAPDWAGAETASAMQALDALGRRIRKLSPLIARRAGEGWVRRGHGDLHLRNLCLFRGRVTAFDALEFDEALACGDILYDLAFLLMDLRAHGLPSQAACVMNLYFDRMGMEPQALALLGPFMALRASIRMSVLLEAHDVAGARSYLTLARALLEPFHPLRGFMHAPDSRHGLSPPFEAAAQLPGPCGARISRPPHDRSGFAAAQQVLAAGCSLLIVGDPHRPDQGLEAAASAFGPDLQVISIRSASGAPEGGPA